MSIVVCCAGQYEEQKMFCRNCCKSMDEKAVAHMRSCLMMVRNILSVATTIFFTALPILAEEPIAQEPPALVKARKDYEAKIKAVVAPLKADYLRQLDKMKKTLGGKGDVAGAQAVQKEIEAVEKWVAVSRGTSDKESSGRWLDVVPRIDITRDRVTGGWMLTKGGVASDGTGPSRLMLPVSIDGGYDLSLEFIRSRCQDGVMVVIPAGSSRCMLVIGGWGGNVSGLEYVDGNRGNQNSTTKTFHFVSNQNYVLLIRVRLQGEIASIEVLLDGASFIQWKGRPSSLELDTNWKLPEPKRPGLAAFHPVSFQSVKVHPVSGKVSFVTR
jgi:hypothetical protein